MQWIKGVPILTPSDSGEGINLEKLPGRELKRPLNIASRFGEGSRQARLMIRDCMMGLSKIAVA